LWRRVAHSLANVLQNIEGEGEAWMDGQDGVVPIGPGTTLVLPANVKHGFRVTGAVPLKTYGVHASAKRIVERDPTAA